MGAQKKKKWSTKGSVRDKVSLAIALTPDMLAKLEADVPKYKLITTSVISDRLKVNGSLARACIKHLVEKKVIVAVSTHNMQGIYTTVIKEEPAAPAEEVAAKEEK
eukprot:TRINITY_DN8954_c0_g1_i1.p3 TRINITY_DN8954_c0_g1~~TRINITY_DN8954_c0_g1_i1.p3  ORF type:complete len:106 (+),score=44.62 TRINITY_DN8954_c0_g1_i1:441-758(+)